MADVSTSASSLQSQSSVSSSVIDDNDVKSTDEIVNAMGADFSKFLNFSVAKEEAKFNDSVEMMLTKMDEFFSLVDMIRSDTSLCLSTTLPDIQLKCIEMNAIFEKIDKMEEFVEMVKECVSATEEKVTKAENDLGTVGGLVKKLTSFVSKKKSPIQSNPRAKRNEFVSPNIFSTADFFDHSKDTDSVWASSSSKEESSLEVSGGSLSPRT